MKLPGKDFLKKAFLVAAAGVGVTSLTGCAVAVRPAHVWVQPAPVYVEPYPVYPVYPGPVIVVPERPHYYYHHHDYRHRW